MSIKTTSVGFLKRLILKFILYFIIFIVLFIAIGFFLNTKTGFRFLEKRSIQEISIASGVSLKKPDNWYVEKKEWFYRLKRVGFKKVDTIDIFSASREDLPDFNGSLSSENKAIGDALTKLTESHASDFTKDNKLASLVDYVTYIKEFQFDSFRQLAIGQRLWAE